MGNISLRVATPYCEAYNGDVTSVTFPGKEGEFGIQEEHMNILSELKPGIIKIDSDRGSESVVVDWGYVEISNNQANVIIDKAIALKPSDDSNTILDNINKAKELLRKASIDSMMLGSLESQIDSIFKK